MKLSPEWIEYTSDGEPVSAYLTRAARARERLPAVVVIQEVWGADAHIRDVADRFAAAGYLALAPDLYSHGSRQPQLAPERIEEAKAFFDALPEADAMDPSKRSEALAQLPPERGRATRETLDALFSPQRPIDRYLADVRAAFTRLREDPACDGRVASIGFCLGGGVSALLACKEPELTGAVVFYGASPLDERIVDIACPVLGIYGAEDERVMAGVPGFASAMLNAGKEFEAVVYAGAPHAFFNDTRSSYTPAAARGAWAQTLSFLARLTPSETLRLEQAGGTRV